MDEPLRDDPLDDFHRRTFTLEGVPRSVLFAGRGPAVVVMAEMPGISLGFLATRLQRSAP